jgi:hypothetical protein
MLSAIHQKWSKYQHLLESKISDFLCHCKVRLRHRELLWAKITIHFGLEVYLYEMNENIMPYITWDTPYKKNDTPTKQQQCMSPL